MDWMNAGISLGRWAGIKVVLSYLFLVWAGLQIFGSKHPGLEAMITVLLFGIVLLHEFGHAFACRIMKGHADHILLWPLGGLAFVSPPQTAMAWLVTTAGGPLVNVLLIPVFLLLHRYAIPYLPNNTTGLYLLFAIIYGMKINLALLFFNLIPVYPLDGGRLLQSILWFFVGYARSLLIAGMTGTIGGISLIGLGLGLAQISIPLPNFIQPYFDDEPSFVLGERGSINGMMVAIGVMAAFVSYQTYVRARAIGKYRQN